jgi:hypothetical protein
MKESGHKVVNATLLAATAVVLKTASQLEYYCACELSLGNLKSEAYQGMPSVLFFFTVPPTNTRRLLLRTNGATRVRFLHTELREPARYPTEVAILRLILCHSLLNTYARSYLYLFFKSFLLVCHACMLSSLSIKL